MASNSEKHMHEARIAALETSVEAIGEDVRSLSHSLDRFARETRDSIQSLGTKMSDSQKTPWGTLAAWAGVVVTLVMLGGSGFVRDLARLELDQANERKTLLNHINSRGHLSLAREVDRNDRSIKEMDDKLQMEMRLIADRISDAVDALDRRLQNELKHGDSLVVSKIEGIMGRLEEAERWMDDHDKRVVGLNAAQWERIKALEREVYGLKELRKGPGQARGSE